MVAKIDWLLLTEKPDQARQFRKALALKDDESPYLDGVVVVNHARGRLFDFAVPDEQNEVRYGRTLKASKSKSLFSVSNDIVYRSDKERLDNMPVLLNSRSDGQIKYKFVDTNAAQIADALVQDLLKAKHVIIATDWDVEGELIFNDLVTYYHLADKLDWNEVYRIHITSLDEESLRDAIDYRQKYGTVTGSNIPDIEKMVSQGYARSIADYEFGYTFSFYNEMLKRQLDLQFKGGLGRLKLSVLNAVLQQENVVKTQDLRKQYRVQIKLPDGLQLELSDVFFSQQDAEDYMAKLNTNLTIKTQQGDKVCLAPELFTRTSYIVTMDRCYDALDWGRPLQSAYETYQSVSYPRTASAYVSMQQFCKLRDLVGAHNVQELLAQRIKERGYDALAFNKLKPRHKYVNEEASKNASHHAIIPTRALNGFDFDRMEAHGDKRAKQAYLEVLYHTMAMFAENGLDKGQLIKLYDQNDHLIISTVLCKTVELGWRKLIDGPVYNDEMYHGKDGMIDVTYQVIEKDVIKKTYYDHPGLLAYLNTHNMGTESTREPVISDLKHMDMIVDNGDGYVVNDVVAKILRVIRVENWVDNEKLNHWDNELNRIENMHDAMSFIQRRRQELIKLNEKVERWYELNQS